MLEFVHVRSNPFYDTHEVCYVGALIFSVFLRSGMNLWKMKAYVPSKRRYPIIL